MKATCRVFALLAGILAIAAACSHTMPPVSRSELSSHRRNWTVGVAGFYDTHDFDYTPEVVRHLQRSGAFSQVKRTHRLADPDADFVVRGNFNFYSVDTRNGFHRFSVYFLTLPLLTGIPNHHIDGMCTAHVDVFREGRLIKSYTYKDVFWAERSYLTVFPAPGLSAELKRIAWHLADDLHADFSERRGAR